MPATAEQTAQEIRDRWDPTFTYVVNDWVPWTYLPRPLNRAKVALITTAGLYLGRNWQAPFDLENPYGDGSFREFPANIELEDLLIGHSHYTHTYAELDLNTVFPLERLRTLEQQELIGSVAPFHYSFMGYNTRPRSLLAEYGPQVAWRLRQASVDAAIVVAVSPLCHQSAALVARFLEVTGIATVCVATSRAHIELAKPPRTVLVDHPFGAPLGPPNNAPMQMEILKDSLGALAEMDKAGSFRTLPYGWREG